MMNNRCANCVYCAKTLTELGYISECLNRVMYIDDPYSDVCESFVKREENEE